MWSRGGWTRARDGSQSLTTWTHLVSSSYVCCNHGTKLCGMLITFERVWAIGRFDVGRSLFVVPQQRRAGTVARRRCFWAIWVTPIRNVPKRGKIVPKQGNPKLDRDYRRRGYPRVSMPKRGTCWHPTFDHSRSPAITHEKKKQKPGWLGGVQEARQTLQVFDLTENMDVGVGEKQCPPFCQMPCFNPWGIALEGPHR